jgi:hypothetical protein
MRRNDRARGALIRQLDSCSYMIVTNGDAVVYNHDRRARQGVVLKCGRWSGSYYFGPHGQAKDFKAGVAQFLEKCAHGSTGR